MSHVKDIDKFYEQARKLEVPHDMKQRIECQLAEFEKTTIPLKPRRHYVRTISAVVAAVAVFAVAATVTLHGHLGTSAQLANETNQPKETTTPKPYDYQSLLGFTPRVPVHLPTGLHELDAQAYLYLNQKASNSDSSYDFSVEYADKSDELVLRIYESTSKFDYPGIYHGTYPPKSFMKKESKGGQTIYELQPTHTDGTLNGPTDIPQGGTAYRMVTKKDGIVYQLEALAGKVSTQQGIDLLQNIRSLYTKSPTGISREYHSLNSLKFAAAGLPFQVVMPQRAPGGYKVGTVLGYETTGDVKRTGLPRMSHGISMKLTKGGLNSPMDGPGITISESYAASKDALPALNNSIKVGSFTVYYQYGKKPILAWYDASRHVVVQITKNETTVSNASLMTMAKAMINSSSS